ncbi:MAG: dihydroorotate dehydrogenase electron transfer subunit [Phycisphaerae bacterium]
MRIIQAAHVVENRRLCREHFELTLSADMFPAAFPGQFVHVNPMVDAAPSGVCNGNNRAPSEPWRDRASGPMLRRAFSIASMDVSALDVRYSIMYRVVGRATRWLRSLGSGATVSVLGPLGNPFPIDARKKNAWMVAGGVGLPPMLWLSEALAAAGKQSVAFYGAQTKALLAIELAEDSAYSTDARRAVRCNDRFSRQGTSIVLATDDGSIGFHGYVGAALEAYYAAQEIRAGDLVVYTCGPEIMMRAVATFCQSHAITCYVCMERAMACGTGTCQSCVVETYNTAGPDGWAYALCCTDGPVFNARDIAWSSR